MPHVWTGDGCEPLDTVSFLGDAKPESEDIAVTRGRITGPDGGDFGSVQEDIQKQVDDQICGMRKRFAMINDS